MDLLIGALDGNLFTSERLVASRAYYHDVITLCVRAKQMISYEDNISEVFHRIDWKVWFIYTLMCVSVVFTGYFMQQYEELQPKWDWFRLTFSGMAPCFGFVSDYQPKIAPNRIFFIFCIFGAMLSYIVTTSMLLLLLKNPMYEKQIQSIEEIIRKDFEIVGDKFAFQHLKMQHQVSLKSIVCSL